MKITVNGAMCATWVDVSRALDWDVQRRDNGGTYASITYHEATPVYDRRGKVCGLVFNGQYFDIPQHYTMFNWYQSNEECTTPYSAGGRCMDADLSLAYNRKQIATQIAEDLKAMGVCLG